MATYLLKLLLVGGIALAFVFWWKSLAVKQLAYRAALRRCDELGLQLLDQSIMLRGIRFKRGSGGRLLVMRRYIFEFSSTGGERYRGEVWLLGATLERVELEPHRL
jgi:hypothetical protein